MSETAIRPSLEQVWSWLSEVPDPEIPVISVVDLGIVRDVAWRGDELVVSVTPTYSGCPATSVISLDIERHLRQQGIANISIKRQLSPAWTTAWISENGRRKLRDYGIAPPIEGGACSVHAGSVAVACPRCGSAETERISQFGSTPCKSQYRCRDCLEPFDHFKCI